MEAQCHQGSTSQMLSGQRQFLSFTTLSHYLATLRIPHFLADSVIHFKRLKPVLSSTFNIFSVVIFSKYLPCCNTEHWSPSITMYFNSQLSGMSHLSSSSPTITISALRRGVTWNQSSQYTAKRKEEFGLQSRISDGERAGTAISESRKESFLVSHFPAISCKNQKTGQKVSTSPQKKTGRAVGWGMRGRLEDAKLTVRVRGVASIGRRTFLERRTAAKNSGSRLVITAAVIQAAQWHSSWTCILQTTLS